MKVVLLKNVDKLGKIGEVKEVAPGFARNYLLPNKLVAIPTDKLVNALAKKAAKQQQKSEEALKKIQAYADKLKDLKIEIKEKADESGKFFAAVTAAKIAKALNAKGHEITKDKIRIPEKIKTAGEYKVYLDLGFGKSVQITLAISAELQS